jgi:hypothetical protein
VWLLTTILVDIAVLKLFYSSIQGRGIGTVINGGA